MRITSGTLGGRHLRVADGMRPTQDMVRQAVFSSLSDFVSGKRVLDLYAGTGAFGLEAWSRGAASVVWVEKDARVFEVLRRNVGDLAGPAAVAGCTRADAGAFIARGGTVFDLVFVDPPYEQSATEALREKTLRGLWSKSMVPAGGVLVFEEDVGSTTVEQPGWALLRDRCYGKTRILIYERSHAENGDLPRDL